MEINFLAVLVATVAMFALGGLWYMWPFGKIWGKMHGFDKLSKKEQDAMASKMGPYYGAQLVVTIISAVALAYFISSMPNVGWYIIAFWLWFGVILPTTVSAVLFGGTEGKYIVTKILIMLGGSLVCTFAGAAIISFF